MAGPLSGLGVQQQTQLTSTSQSGQNSSQQVRQQEERREPVENTTQPRNSAAAESQRTDSQVQGEALSRDQVEERASHSNERGTILDITV